MLGQNTYYLYGYLQGEMARAYGYMIIKRFW